MVRSGACRVAFFVDEPEPSPCQLDLLTHVGADSVGGKLPLLKETTRLLCFHLP